MIGNALFNPGNTPYSPGRRHSHLDVSLAPKLSQRRATSPVINVDGMSPGLGYMMGSTPYGNGPSTPCFVTPTMGAFSQRRFSFDSPLQSYIPSGGLPTINKKAAKRAWARVSTKKWSKSFKMVMILILTSFAMTLFLLRKSTESAVPVQMRSMDEPSCNEHTGTCDAPGAHYHENNPKEDFMGIVAPAEHYHELEPEDSNLWVNRWTEPEQEPMGYDNLQSMDASLAAPAVEAPAVDLWANRWSDSESPIVNEEAADIETLPYSQDDLVEQDPIGSNNLPFEDAPLEVPAVEESDLWVNRWAVGLDEGTSEIETPADSQVHVIEQEPIVSEILPSEEVSAVEVTEINPSHVHVLNGATSWHENDHSHALWAMQNMAQLPNANAVPQQPIVPQQPLVPQQPTGQMQAPTQGLAPNMLHQQVPQQQAGHMQVHSQASVSNMLQPPPVQYQPMHLQGQAGVPQQNLNQVIGNGRAGVPQQNLNQVIGNGQAAVPQQYTNQGIAHGQAPPPHHQQYYNQGMPPQQPTGHLRPAQPQVIGVPAHHMPQQQQYAHPMPNSGQVLPPGVNPLRYNQYPQAHSNQQPQYNQQSQYNHQANIIGHNPPHQSNQGQKLPPGVNPNHYRAL